MAENCEVLIIGAGLIGSSVAMHLGEMGVSGVRVIDFDLEGSLSSSELNAGGVRATWGQAINVEMSKRSIEYFATHAAEVGYRACGYLWLYEADRLPFALQAREQQLRMGWPVEAWDVAELRRKVPLIDKTDTLAGAVFAPRDGLVNPNLLKNHFRAKARQAGVVFDDRTLLRQAEELSSGGWKLMAERHAAGMDLEQRTAILSGKAGASTAHPIEYRAAKVINCAGAWAAEVARALGYHAPTVAIRRQVCIFDCRGVDLNEYGMIVDSSGVYFHPEATNGLAGFANHHEKPGANFQYDGESFFMEVIWPALYERSSSFERLKHLTGWAGLYEVSPDESAILGAVDDKGRLYEAHSFSGHGVMQSYAAGLVLAELISRGRYETLDATAFSAKRFETGRLLQERLVI